MVPDKFNMVDMDGIDLIMAQGEEVPGLYNRLVESIAQCRYQCLYNWFFDGVVIPPSYVEMEVNEDDEIAINEGVTVSPDDVIHIYSLAPGPVDPEIIPLLAEENGVYNVPAGKDGFNPVTVDVPSYTPVINSLSINENGTYTAPSGVDGYSPVTVNVPSDEPVIDPITITENGTYTAPSGVDGFDPITVNVSGSGIDKLQFHYGRLEINTGAISESSEYCYSDMVEITTGSGYWLVDLDKTDLTGLYIGLCFYTSDGVTIADYMRQYEVFRKYKQTLPTGRYFRIALKVNQLQYAKVIFDTDNIIIAGSSSDLYQTEL